MNMERKGVLSPSLFNFIVSCSTNLTGRCLNLYITHLHSSFYQLSTHSQAHRCICSCPVCSHSAVHTHRCLAENIHPFLSGRNQNKSRFPNQPNPLMFLRQCVLQEDQSSGQQAEQVQQQTSQIQENSLLSNTQRITIATTSHRNQGCLFQTEAEKMVSCKDFTLLYSHLLIGFGFVFCWFVCFVWQLTSLEREESKHQPIMVSICMELQEAIPRQQHSWECMQIVAHFQEHVSCCSRFCSQVLTLNNLS